MRYSLRNKKKIESAFNRAILSRIIKSLDEAFEYNTFSCDTIEGEKYDLLSVNDKGHTCGLIMFYVISKTFDVYNLAFKEFIN